jgi:hypothetical protein
MAGDAEAEEMMILLGYLLTWYTGPFPVSDATAYAILHEMVVEVVVLWGYVGVGMWTRRKA